MKKLTYLMGFFLVGLIAVAQDQNLGQNRVVDDFENMSFQVALEKDTYLLFEPLYATFRFSNQTGKPQTTYIPVFLRESTLIINFNGSIKEYYPLNTNIPIPFRFPGVSRPGAVYEEEGILSSMLDLWFPEPGSYQLQFVLRSIDGAKTISSNTIELTIAEPRGLEKEAYEFLKIHEKYAGLFFWVHVEKDNLPYLEEFVSKYSQTPYGELAIYHLGAAYKWNGDLDKAQAEFEKLKSSKRKSIADEAEKALNDVKERKALLQKSKPEKQPQ